MEALPELTMLDRMIPLFMYTLASIFLVALVVAILWFIDRFFLPNQDLRRELDSGNIAWAIVIFGIIYMLGGMFQSAMGSPSRDRYDHQFKRYWSWEFGTRYHWTWEKAQAMTESGMKVRVCSSVGACGLMQFMPATAREWKIDPFRPREAIWAAARYDRRLWSVFKAPRPDFDRLAFAFMSYNAGLGNVLKFQKAATAAGADPNLFHTIYPFAWVEPREYVERISRWQRRFGRGR